ncbi:hydroquinone glucosyltransferase-like [Vicia villosa]|uniref:hydroquinone glucosyltransferase-like n=1 Tax=Vicia villosa TaxID=3911 RepID=UPI00273B7884|nr:hydroquinone glucosyltransferase-like [Vicia villosa]
MIIILNTEKPNTTSHKLVPQTMSTTTHIAVIPSPGFSHLVPIVEFTKRLVTNHPNFHITCIIPSLGSLPDSSKSYLDTIPPNINSIFLPPINKQDLPQGAYPAVLIQQTVTLSLPSIHQALKSLTSKAPLVAIIADAFAIEALDFAKEFNSLSFLYFPCSAFVLSLVLHFPKLDQEVSCEYKDLQEPLKLQGCVPINGIDLPTPTQNRSSEAYKMFLERAKRLFSVDGVLFNSFFELESSVIRALEQEGHGKISFFPVGPITQIGSSDSNDVDDEFECLKWLKNQPQNSVLYVSFGSGGTLSQKQINELAFGLELSGQRFIWVVRAPSDSANAAYLEATNEDPLKFLPQGFLERTKEKGLILPLWAPQVEILKQNSVGGFLSHCGWNSILESIQEGVPIVAWPLFAEQAMNAVMLSDGLKVAVRLKFEDDEIVEKEEIAKVIKCVMEGEEGKGMRERIKKLKDSAVNALKSDGSSIQTLSKLARKLESFGGI